MKVGGQGIVQVTVEAEHRDGQGKLIAKTFSIQGPQPPACTRPSCIWEFFKDSLYSALLSIYHTRRVRYAEERRHKRIPEKYRTGDPSPKNIKQAAWAIIKLRLRR